MQTLPIIRETTNNISFGHLLLCTGYLVLLLSYAVGPKWPALETRVRNMATGSTISSTNNWGHMRPLSLP